MMIKTLMMALGVILSLASPSTALAERQLTGREVYALDKSHTNIMWFANHLGFSTSMGQFMDFDGRIILDHDNPDQSSVTITLQTASIMTGQEKFDTHLKSADFFNVEKYPTASFVSTKVTLLTDNRATVEGNFTLLGVTKPLTLKIRLNKRAMDLPTNVMRSGFSVSTTIKRSRWGMKYYVPFVGDEVRIRIEAEALIVDDKTG